MRQIFKTDNTKIKFNKIYDSDSICDLNNNNNIKIEKPKKKKLENINLPQDVIDNIIKNNGNIYITII